jgi:hypothetical protein
MTDVMKLIALGTVATLMAPFTWWAVRQDFKSLVQAIKEFVPDEKALKLYGQDHHALRLSLKVKAEALRERFTQAQTI